MESKMPFPSRRHCRRRRNISASTARLPKNTPNSFLDQRNCKCICIEVCRLKRENLACTNLLAKPEFGDSNVEIFHLQENTFGLVLLFVPLPRAASSFKIAAAPPPPPFLPSVLQLHLHRRLPLSPFQPKTAYSHVGPSPSIPSQDAARSLLDRYSPGLLICSCRRLCGLCVLTSQFSPVGTMPLSKFLYT